MKLLIVDADRPFVEALKGALRVLAPAVDLIWAPSGARGLLDVGLQRPDGILVDVCLSEVDGIEFCRNVRSEPSLAHVRLLAFSGHWREGTKRDALVAGVDACLEKPFDALALIAALDLTRTAGRVKYEGV